MRAGAERDDSMRRLGQRGRPLGGALNGHRVDPDGRAGRLGPLAAGGPGGEQRECADGERDPHATHCQSAHCTTATPSSNELTQRMAVCARGRRPTTASARKNGKIVNPKRGIESKGQRSLGTLSGIGKLTAAKGPYGAPNRRHAMTVSTANRTRNARFSRLIVAARIGSVSCTAVQ